MEKSQISEELIKTLGPLGFKSPKRNFSHYNGHLLIFRANICVQSYGKVWYGDLDFTTDEAKLKKLSRKIGLSFYILKELDNKFTTENSPSYEKSLIKVTPHKIFLGDELQINSQRNESGKLVLKYDLSFLYKEKKDE